MKRWEAAVLLWVMVIGIGTGAALAVYNGSGAYSSAKAEADVNLAASSNNLSEVLIDLNASLAVIAPYHGNPSPFFPAPGTNWDLVKAQIATTIQSGEVVVHESPDNYSYQQALKNIQSDLTTTVSGELNNIGNAIMWWDWGIYFTIIVIVCIPLTVAIGIVGQ
jgi:hypothetical protein